jgi:pimeloyl-ACP methyl ester carboxylesterase
LPTRRRWPPGISALASDGRRVIAVDLPGPGFRAIKGARMHFPDYRTAEFIPRLQRRLRSHD